MNAKDKKIVESIIRNLQLVEGEWDDDLTAEIEWLRGLTQEKPVSDGLKEEIERCWNAIFPLGYSKTSLLTLTHEEHIAFARHFANWQRQKDLKEGLDSDALPAAYLDGVEKGKRMMREQMTAKAFPVEIDSSRSDGRCILSGNFARFETGDKVKVIVVNEDWL